MGARLRFVLDQLGQIVDPDLASAAVDLADGVIATAPSGCTVDLIVPAGSGATIRGVGEVRTLGLARRELAASWQLGIAPGVGGGMIHSPSLFAPLVKHDRVHDDDQTTVTLWDLRAWDAPELLPKNQVSWQRGMLRRAVKHADAVVVPSHAVAARLSELARLGDRVRVIAGAPPRGFVVPDDADRRRNALSLPEEYVVLTGSEPSLRDGFRGAAAAGIEAVVLDAPDGAEPRYVEIASAAGLPERRAHVRGALAVEDRAAALAGASVFAATGDFAGWPWRAVEAMALGVPVVAVDTGSHRDVIADGGTLVTGDEIADAIEQAAGPAAERLRILASDRSRAFSWASSGERLWSLHADL